MSSFIWWCHQLHTGTGKTLHFQQEATNPLTCRGNETSLQNGFTRLVTEVWEAAQGEERDIHLIFILKPSVSCTEDSAFAVFDIFKKNFLCFLPVGWICDKQVSDFVYLFVSCNQMYPSLTSVTCAVGDCGFMTVFLRSQMKFSDVHTCIIVTCWHHKHMNVWPMVSSEVHLISLQQDRNRAQCDARPHVLQPERHVCVGPPC